MLGIRRASGEFLGAPTGRNEIRAGDTLVLYGHETVLDGLGQRKAGATGQRAHQQAVSDPGRVVANEQAADPDRSSRS